MAVLLVLVALDFMENSDIIVLYAFIAELTVSACSVRKRILSEEAIRRLFEI
jgi:hypothetical protein